METVNFLGHACRALKNANLSLLVTYSVGPRILSFGFKDGENIFAELRESAIEYPGHGTFHFYGGHRLWLAPEEPARTYLPDDLPVDVSPVENGLLATQRMEQQTGLQKSLEIHLPDEPAHVVVTHRLTNLGELNVTCAPWAITQFKTGGVAILPQTRNDTGVLPSRSLTLWPYTDMTNPNIHWGSSYILVSVEMRSPFKIGFPNPRGWLAYWLNGTLFVKHAEYDGHANYYDFGSSSECYCNDQFLELETLATIGMIAPGETVSHTELWDLYKDIERPHNEGEVQLLVEQLGLE
jgi:hypothetical protein